MSYISLTAVKGTAGAVAAWVSYTLLEEFADIPRFIRGNPNYPPEEPDFSDSAEKS